MDNKQIVKKIDDLRVKRGWSFYKLSQETGLTQQTFTKWMTGNTTPTLPALELICNAFDITLSNFFSENNLVEVTDDLKTIINKWNYLNNAQKQSILSIVDNFISKNES